MGLGKSKENNNTSRKTKIDGKHVTSKVPPPLKTHRDHFKSPWHFFLSLVGFGVGIGNVWRFPYICYKGGGGAFLIIYLLSVFFIGIPIFFLEISMGQWMDDAGLSVWNIVPIAKGIGIAMLIVLFYLCMYYNIIVAWALRYMFAVFTKVLPWKNCQNSWNTICCMQRLNRTHIKIGHLHSNQIVEASNISMLMEQLDFQNNSSPFNNCNESSFTDHVEQYWRNNVLEISEGVGQLETVRWDLALCLLLAWILVFVCLMKGIHSLTIVMYFTVIMPYVCLVILLITGATMPGAKKGVSWYLYPNLTVLKDVQVWADAGTQVFFSYSLSIGALYSLGSYNEFHHNSFRDCFLFAAINSLTSILAGFSVFTVIGSMASQYGIPIQEVATAGPGLTFVAFPKALLQLPAPQFFSFLFFLTIVSLGLDTQFIQVQGFAQAIVDMWPNKLGTRRRRQIVLLCFCIIEFIFGLIFVTRAGAYILQLIDIFSGSRVVLLLAAIQCCAIGYVYGIDRYIDNMTVMLEYPFPRWIKWIYLLITPIFTFIIFIFSLTQAGKFKYGNYLYPNAAVRIGWTITFSTLSSIFIYAGTIFYMTPGTYQQRWKELTYYELLPHQVQAIEESVYDHRDKSRIIEAKSKLTDTKDKLDGDLPISDDEKLKEVVRLMKLSEDKTDEH
ncbi:hypothetical protein SNEBB_001132 [Seison nebaliae]|nr:hypothetical protein SNEBB_001132 [Seison nebaliae]